MRRHLTRTRFRHHGDVETFPVVILLLGAQAAGDMGLTDPTWAYVLQDAGRVGITTIVWGDVPKAPLAVHAGFDEAVAVIAGRRPDDASYTLLPIGFAPAILSPDVRPHDSGTIAPIGARLKPGSEIVPGRGGITRRFRLSPGLYFALLRELQSEFYNLIAVALL